MSADKPNRKRRKPRQPAKRKNTRVTGERSEAAFLHKAANLGFGVAKPRGDSCRYDFILDNGSCLHRVQVKCTESIRARAYETRATYTTGKGRAPSTPRGTSTSSPPTSPPRHTVSGYILVVYTTERGSHAQDRYS